jgi:hypothetical protein
MYPPLLFLYKIENKIIKVLHNVRKTSFPLKMQQQKIKEIVMKHKTVLTLMKALNKIKYY